MSDSSYSAIADIQTLEPVEALLQAFLRHYPYDAARKLESMSVAVAVEVLQNQTADVRQRVWPLLNPTFAAEMLRVLSTETAIDLLSIMEPVAAASLLSRLDNDARIGFFEQMGQALAHELKELLSYPPNSAGQAMDTRVLTFHRQTRVADALAQLKSHTPFMRRHLYTLDDEHRLDGKVELEVLIVADPEQLLGEISKPATDAISGLDPIEDVAERLNKQGMEILPVVDVQHRLLGIIRGRNALNILKEEMTADLQTMVGASRDEQALSSAMFAFKKRQPWLQINLLTGFLAATIVGLFESTIAQFTALAVLMPVAAGQSGNTGAQALAVTMRGLTLREITIRHWYRVMFKEAGAGLMNGIAIAVSCGAGVYIWSQSAGLALVISLAMVISMVIAAMSGALVPMMLKRFGMDPAQSSSIILTTITDIAGFMSFLGIATALSFMLV